MEAKRISVSRNRISIAMSRIDAVGALFWIDALARIRWTLRGRSCRRGSPTFVLLSLCHIPWATAVHEANTFSLERHHDTK